MHPTTLLPLLLPTALAAPYELLSKRALRDGDWAPDYATGCPRTLGTNEYEVPQYITQISARRPHKAFGPKKGGVFTPNDVATIFSFDIPASRADANCTLEFLFPRREQLRGSPSLSPSHLGAGAGAVEVEVAGAGAPFEYEGGGSFFFTGYKAGSCPGPETTFANQPELGPYPPFPPIHMEPGYAYTIDVGPCFVAAGGCVAGVTSTNDTRFSYLQDDKDCPIGIYTSYSYGLPCEAPYC